MNFIISENGWSWLLVATMWIIFSVSSTSANGSEASVDVAGSSDSNLLQRYPRSHIIAYEEFPEVTPQILNLGSLKKIKNIISAKKSRKLDGKLTRITYRIPGGNRSREVSEFFKSQIVAAGKMLFSCQQRECGSSNYWANTIFQKAELYGPEENQYLLVGQFRKDNQAYFVTVYTIQRGNKRVYSHLEIIAGELKVSKDPATMLKMLETAGIVTLKDVKFDTDNRLIDDPNLITRLVKMLSLNSSVNVYIVAHLAAAGSLEDASVKSKHRAEQLMDKLVQSGIAINRLSAHGVGPLAPVQGTPADRIGFVLRR